MSHEHIMLLLILYAQKLQVPVPFGCANAQSRVLGAFARPTLMCALPVSTVQTLQLAALSDTVILRPSGAAPSSSCLALRVQEAFQVPAIVHIHKGDPI